MAIYRSDQAVVTFAAEAALGGYPEAATIVTQTTASADVDGAHAAGSLVITIDNLLNGLAVGDMIRIGSPDKLAGSKTSLIDNEVRRLVALTDSDTKLHLNAPTAFHHGNNEIVTKVTAITDDSTDIDKFVTYIPGVYDTVTTPDFTPTIEPRYFLGTGSKRNFSTAYKGTQSYNGSWPSFILLNGWPLRFPIGNIEDTCTTGSGTSFSADVKAGDRYFTLSASTGTANNAYLLVGNSPNREIVRLHSSNGTNAACKITTPLKYDHSSGDAAVPYSSGAVTHTITEANVLPSISMGVHMLDSDETAANAFDRKFFGGKVGAATISAEEGGLLVMGWDTIPFMGMSHNQKDDDNFTGNVPFYQLAHVMDRTMVGSKTGTTADGVTYPTADPYYFSEGTVSLFGTEFARLRNFTININNNVEPRYYIERRGDSRNRGPSDIVEMRREYTMEATIALPDSQAATDSTTTLFKELLLEGDYGSGMRGFNIKLLFTRGTNDTITIQIPDDGDLTAADQSPSGSTGAATGLDQQGAYLLETPHPIDGSNPYEVSASLMFRNLKMTIVDSQMLYP